VEKYTNRRSSSRRSASFRVPRADSASPGRTARRLEPRPRSAPHRLRGTRARAHRRTRGRADRIGNVEETESLTMRQAGFSFFVLLLVSVFSV